MADYDWWCDLGEDESAAISAMRIDLDLPGMWLCKSCFSLYPVGYDEDHMRRCMHYRTKRFQV